MIREFDGKIPRIDEGTFISEASYIIGDVEIGEGTGVWYGAVIRGDMGRIRIGRNCEIEDNVILHCGKEGIEIGDEVIIGHGAVIHGAKVGRRTVIGMGSIILDGSEIGEECIIAAGTLIPPNTKIPPRSLVMGNPGEIKGRAHKLEELIKRHHESYIPVKEKYRGK